MMTKEEYLKHVKFPRLLSLEEINDPHQVIDEFFSFYSLPNIRDDLKKWYHAALEDDIIAASGKMSNLFSFYQNIEKLIEANYIINEGQATEKVNS